MCSYVHVFTKNTLTNFAIYFSKDLNNTCLIISRENFLLHILNLNVSTSSMYNIRCFRQIFCHTTHSTVKIFIWYICILWPSDTWFIITKGNPPTRISSEDVIFVLVNLHIKLKNSTSHTTKISVLFRLYRANFSTQHPCHREMFKCPTMTLTWHMFIIQNTL